MAVYDRWHKDPAPGDQPCKCRNGRGGKLYPGKEHLKGSRWQVQWEDPSAPTRKRPTKNFALRDGDNPNIHADAFDKLMQGKLVTKNYTDPRAGEVTLRDYAEQWRKTRTHGESARKNMEARLRLHVYEDPADPGCGRTPAGGVSIGQHSLALLDRQPSLTAAWAASIPGADSSRNLVIGDVSSVFQVAIGDRIIGADPTKSKSVDRPGRAGAKARPYAAAEVAGLAGEMPGWFRIVPELGAGTGMRMMEMAGLGADDIVRGAAPKVRVLRQVKVVGGELRFGPVKNFKPHDVPVPPALVKRLDAHMRAHPPATVTLPWHEPGSKLHGTMMTVRLVLSHQGGAVTWNVMQGTWTAAAERWAMPEAKRRERSARGLGIHRLRHTFASVQLREGTDPVRVAAWLGDTVAVVMKTYLHLMPDDRDGERAGRAASAAFLGACARNVGGGAKTKRSGQLRAV